MRVEDDVEHHIGSVTLQGAYSWSQGNEGGIIWKEIPEVAVDEHGRGDMD